MSENDAWTRIKELDREMRELGLTRPQLDRPDYHRDQSRVRRMFRRVVGTRAAIHRDGSKDVTLRMVKPGDRELVRLARLDERRTPTGDALVAEIDGQMVAAVPLADGPALVDPLMSGGDLVELLELRRRQVDKARRQSHVTNAA